MHSNILHKEIMKIHTYLTLTQILKSILNMIGLTILYCTVVSPSVL